jgi:hypothetical protein
VSDFSPATVVATLSDIAKRIDAKADEVAVLDRAHVEARHELKRAYARAFLSAAGSNDVKRYTAEEATADLALAADLAEQVLRAGREALRVLRDRLDVGRSVSSIVKLEWSA